MLSLSFDFKIFWRQHLKDKMLAYKIRTNLNKVRKKNILRTLPYKQSMGGFCNRKFAIEIDFLHRKKIGKK